MDPFNRDTCSNKKLKEVLDFPDSITLFRLMIVVSFNNMPILRPLCIVYEVEVLIGYSARDSFF